MARGGAQPAPAKKGKASAPSTRKMSVRRSSTKGEATKDVGKSAVPRDGDREEKMAYLDKHLGGLKTPGCVQAFIDTLKYNTDDEVRCPYDSIRVGKAHCFDGALVAAAGLKRLGLNPSMVYLEADQDDSHVICVFEVIHNKNDRRYGAVAKSNFVGLRYREPIFVNIRELVMSYFEQYYNIDKVKTLRGYATPVRFPQFEKYDWEVSPKAIHYMELAFGAAPVHELLPKGFAKSLLPVDPRSYEAGMLGTDLAGCYGSAEKNAEKAKAK